MVVRNMGTATWDGVTAYRIDVGTEGQYDQTTALGHYGEDFPDSFEGPGWVTPKRPIEGITKEVPPGDTYTFDWLIKAPDVGIEEQYVLSFAALADRSNNEHPSGWMDEDSKFGSDFNPLLIVKPWAEPTATVSVEPETVAPGEAFKVKIDATAVASVNHVIFQYAGQTIEAVRQRNPSIAGGQQAQWLAGQTFVAAGSGEQPVLGAAFDDSGRGSQTAAAYVDVAPKTSGGGVPVVEPAGHGGVADSRQVALPRLPEFKVRFFQAPSAGHSRLALTKLIVTKVGPGDRVVGHCSQCRGVSAVGPVTARSSTVTFKLRRAQVTSRSSLTFDVTKAGYQGVYKSYKFNVRSREVDPIVSGCLTSSGQAREACT